MPRPAFSRISQNTPPFALTTTVPVTHRMKHPTCPKKARFLGIPGLQVPPGKVLTFLGSRIAYSCS